MVKFLKKFIDIVFIVIIAILSLYFILRLTGIVNVYKVETGSMENSIHVNDYIFVWKTKNYTVKDVVTFEYEDTYVTHRIVKVDENNIVTKGDANNTEDDPVSVDKVVGEVIYSGGLLNIVINYKYIIIAIMIGIYILSIYLDKKDVKEKEVKNEEV